MISLITLIQFQNILTPFSGFCISFPPLFLTLYLSLTHTHSLTNIQLPFFLWRDTRLLSCMTCDCYNSLYLFYDSWPLAIFFLLWCNNIFIATNKKKIVTLTLKKRNLSSLCTVVFWYTYVCASLCGHQGGQNIFFLELAPFHWDINSVELVKPQTMLNWNLN